MYPFAGYMACACIARKTAAQPPDTADVEVGKVRVSQDLRLEERFAPLGPCRLIDLSRGVEVHHENIDADSKIGPWRGDEGRHQPCCYDRNIRERVISGGKKCRSGEAPYEHGKEREVAHRTGLQKVLSIR